MEKFFPKEDKRRNFSKKPAAMYNPFSTAWQKISNLAGYILTEK